MSYDFKVDVFEGPLDLLLYLIKEQKMDIYDIPIAEITRQYLEYLEVIKELNLEAAGDYLVMAAELTRIKSQTLLPREEVEVEEEGTDPREELTRRLLEYQRYKEAAFELRLREYDTQQVFSRQGEVVLEDEDAEEDPLVDATVFDLLTAFQNMMRQKSFKKDYEIKITILSVEDRINYILEILNTSESTTFESLFSALDTKQEVVVLFLALLELMRLSLVRIQQSQHLGNIRVYKSTDKETQEAALKEYQETQAQQEDT